jgi:Right handed beta helix region
MRNTRAFFEFPVKRTFRSAVTVLVVVTLVAGLTVWKPELASANHPVLVEGEKDYDGDGLVGSAEDTDNATDRIFGTINGALGNIDLGPAINATHANQNGRVVIVTSGRFPEGVSITAANGNVSLEAAPGVDADIDAVVQGAAGNAGRQANPGIIVNAPANRYVTIRNIMSRNWTEEIRVMGDSRVTIANCRFENNVSFGIHVLDNARVAINNSQVNATGFRQAGGVNNTPSPGIGIQFEDSSSGSVAFTTVSGSFSVGLANDIQTQGSVFVMDVNTFDNNPNFRGFFRQGAVPANF